ncbi:Protein translocase subunit SecA [hydrothermal vent metagenome]|uniref:Protein translocase subunit SecA n=1 Tax=hydrothermal vent metagenome TaxID=652676 RepID=A0A3B1CDZ4_9ZZZZ
MLGYIVRGIFGSRNDRELKRLQAYVEATNALEAEIQQLDDGQLRGKTAEFKQRVKNGEPLDDLLPEAFAVTREASLRTLNMRHFDVQIVGGVALHEGKITEMKTGEGKTLVATLPLYLNSLAGRGAHLVTVNDYLARRDSEWMGAIFRFLGLSVGVVQHGISDEERAEAYNSDITYGTNNEFGFDYLRDNMKFSLDECVQREMNFAIVDEVDSILIDEARTPLIISGQAEDSTDKYYTINRITPQLLKKDVFYTVDEKAKAVMLTEEGIAVAEKALSVDNLYDPENIEILHHVQQALRAHTLFSLDVDYMIKDNQVVIVDEFTGRLMPGRRWSDGLHQAIEAKESVKIENENQTLATITFQNYFRLYDKLAGMTGTADTEAAEFSNTYNMEVLAIPPNMDMIRKDHSDVIYRTQREKFNAIIDDVCEKHAVGQPTLVGTISIEKSELLSGLLKRRGVKHNVLNAKHHEKEAEIVAQAGRKAAVTIATNMAGRGTDIILGGNPEMLAFSRGVDTDDDEYEVTLEELKVICEGEKEEVIKAGGLHIIGTERHESRRIDNQLRGRSGRQGDPGSSRFFLSLEDDLLRIFGSDRISGLMEKLGMEEGEPIEAKLVTKAIENAQKKVEGHNFDIRKHLLEYDDVMNKQREVIYEQRKMILAGADLHETIIDMAVEVLAIDMDEYTPESKTPEEWDIPGLHDALKRHFLLDVEVDENNNIAIGSDRLSFDTVMFDQLQERLEQEVKAGIERKKEIVGAEQWHDIEKYITLNIVDSNWKDHLLSMDHLKEGIGLRGYAQKNPLNEYKREGSQMFVEMIDTIREDSISSLFRVRVQSEEEARKEKYSLSRTMEKRRMTEHRGDGDGKVETVRRTKKKIGRNEPCPCGSGKKYKKCHGKS